MIATVAPPGNSHVATSPGLAASASVGTSDKQECLSLRDCEELARDYADRLFSVARRFLHDEEDAADAVQDAFLAAWNARHTFQGESTVYTWLYRIVVNVCLMKVRARRRATVVSLDELLPTFDQDECHRHPAVDWSQGAACCLEREETRVAVRACIDRLPHDYRTILLLCDIEQWDSFQTAESLKLSRGAVKTRLHRARRALRSLLEPELQ